MKVHLDCFPCFLRQAVQSLDYINIDNSAKMDILRSVVDELKIIDINKPPAYATTFIYRKIRELSNSDPFRDIKYRYNEIAMKLYPGLKEKIFKSFNPLWTAARFAIAGNIIDFGIFKTVDIDGAMNRAIDNDIEIDNFERFSIELEKYNDVLYLLDNAGEIVFDMLLIEILKKMGKKVTAVIKGDAVINDATMDDAIQIGLTDICRVIDNGSDAVGTIIQWCSERFIDEFNSSNLIISKGQGNFETLQYNNKNIFFLFQAKCDVVANELGLERGAMILMYRYSRRGK